MKETVFLVSCAILAVVPVALVAHRVYHDRILGRAALLGIAFAAWTYLIEAIIGTRYNLLPQTALMFGCVAAFFCWHYIRFHLRVLGWRREGRSANDIQHTVQFNTFAEICEHRGSRDITVRLCRNPQHEAANTGVAVCAEPVCPIVKQK